MTVKFSIQGQGYDHPTTYFVRKDPPPSPERTGINMQFRQNLAAEIPNAQK